MSEEYPLRKTDLRGIPVEEDLPPPGRPASMEYPLWKTWHKAGKTCRPRNTHRGRPASEEYPLRKVCDSSKNDTSEFPRLLGIALRNTGGIPKTYIFWLWGAPSRIIKCGLPVVEYLLRKV